MGTIYLNGLICHSSIGVWEWEQYVRQRLTIDIEVDIDFSVAAKTDDLEDAVNYQLLADKVIELAESVHFNLLESLAEKMASMILVNFKVSKVRLKIDKGTAVKGVKNVGIKLERSVVI